jgi:hypothetical protein
MPIAPPSVSPQKLRHGLLALGVMAVLAGTGPESRRREIGRQAVCGRLHDLSPQPARPGQGPLPSVALPVPATALRHQFQIGLGARLLSGVGGRYTGRPIASRHGEAIAACGRHVAVFTAPAASGVRTLARPPGFRSASRNKDIGRHPGSAGCPNRTLFSPHFPGIAVRRDGGDRMKKKIAIVALALSLVSSLAIAQERAGDAALGALSGAVVLGPIGAVAGAVVGYTAGPSISRSWRGRRSSGARPVQRPARQATRPSSGDSQLASRNQAGPTMAQQAPAASPKTASNTPPVQGLE